MITTLILLTLAGIVISIVIGTLWHGPNTPTGRLHMQYLGFDKLSPEEQIELKIKWCRKILNGGDLLEQHFRQKWTTNNF